MKYPSVLYAIAVLGGAAMPSAGMAATEEGQFAMKGRGQTPCSTYIEARASRTQEYLRYGSWLTGYLTAYNQLKPDTMDIAPWQGVDLLAAFLANYCERNPDASFFAAVDAMTNALFPQRIRGKARFETIGDGDNKIQVYDAVIRRLQTNLAERGLYDGKVDGDFGPNTRRAIEEFQKDADIPATGLPDQRTLYALFQ
jgi:hypothetical protein